MAKHTPPSSLSQMESTLGYTAADLDYSDDGEERFYSDLCPVSKTSYEKTRRELDEYLKLKHRKDFESTEEQLLPEAHLAQTIDSCGDCVVLEGRNTVGLYNFTADIYYGSEFHLPLRLTKVEALAATSVAKFKRDTASNAVSKFFMLPRELRDLIYTYAVSKRGCRIIGPDERSDEHLGINLARGIGDPSGFFFPLRNDLNVLQVNEQMRNEALSLAYRETAFYLGDIDDFIRFAVSIGRIGRDNVETLNFSWMSRADDSGAEGDDSEAEDLYPRLPRLHVERCVNLLKLCKKLKYLCISFESEVLSNTSFDDFKHDPGMCGLCSIVWLNNIEIWSLSGEPLDEYEAIRWLKGTIRSRML
ncbi:hypothetical protein PHISCL_02273 [Aspergillus sclerotialis]|uniref:Uncharacterized protein n=1 Tax=Aspergillus sclerotialis TaxID=2070753 RepID=A0A3A2ZQF6_9EURO|nr:hypothetical protein PHISCL_02273 [Aspergillus sclerotialis]